MTVNVLQLIGSFHQGGSERQAVQLVRLLREEKNYRIFPACLDGRGVLREEIERLGYREIPEFPLSSFYDANMVRQLRQCVKYLRANDIKVIQTHDFYTNVFGMLAGALARVPVRIAAKRETGTKSGKQAFLERRAYNLAHAIVANAGAVKEHLIKTGVAAEKIEVIHNGLDLERLRVADDRTRGEILADLGLPADRGLKFVSIVANLRSEVKNHRMFLRSARRIRERYENARFVLAGEGELTAPLRELAGELLIAADCFFIGRCARVSELLAVSEIGVLSSRTEGFSNSILEYMAAAKPVVATDVGGAGEAVTDGQTGFLVSSGDDAALAERVIELLKNPDQARDFGTRGRKVIEEKFSLNAQLAKTLKLYERLLSADSKNPKSKI